MSDKHPNNIFTHLHCKKCCSEAPPGQSPAEWSRLTMGWTKRGVQLWCERHDVNVVELEFDINSVWYATSEDTLGDDYRNEVREQRAAILAAQRA
jgi:hypothetical protein